jgi:isopenicillin N synthase-like dioxygenase
MIPIIDYGPYFAGEEGALERLSAQVAYAGTNIGLFYALNHGVPAGLVERALAASRRFFALPLEQKLAVKLNSHRVGYLPIDASVQAAATVHKAIVSSRSESFFVSHDRGPDHAHGLGQRARCSGNQWPADVPGLRTEMMAYFAALGAMCQRTLPAFAVALGIPADFFACFFDGEPHAMLRFLHYPPHDPSEGKVFGQRPHTDNSFMTVLARTGVPGLEVRLPSGEWFPPPVIPGTFLIHLGNIMRRWSNDRCLSAPHAVVNVSAADRYSIAYFHNPHPDRVIDCLPSCCGHDNPPRYHPTLYSDLLADFCCPRSPQSAAITMGCPNAVAVNSRPV